ncbi:MAG TPA: hypothetical protein VFP32_02385, partial [Candidatus Saccharimonadales bacterium]|nr:hypothetical protein [Candidatus Saccharimonadales bacterium]
MKIRRLLYLSSSIMVSLSSLLVINFGRAFAVANNCTWTGASSNNFNDATNWSSCNSTVPQTGDNLVFDNTSLGADATVNNDMTGLSAGSIVLNGSGDFGFILTGNPLTVTGGISNSASSTSSLELDMALTLTGDQTITATPGGGNFITFGDYSSPSTLNIGTSNITISQATVQANDAISGSGSITTSTPVALAGDNSGYSGDITINSGGEILVMTSTSPFGSGAVTVNSGASLYFALPGDTTVANDITLSGTGVDQSTGTLQNADFIHFGPGNGPANGGKLTLSGTVTLSSDVVYSGDLATGITGTYTPNGHTISVLAGAQGTITTPSGTV